MPQSDSEGELSYFTVPSMQITAPGAAGVVIRNGRLAAHRVSDSFLSNQCAGAAVALISRRALSHFAYKVSTTPHPHPLQTLYPDIYSATTKRDDIIEILHARTKISLGILVVLFRNF